MSEKSMAYFMKGKAKQLPEEELVISERFLDDEGKPIPFKFRAISQPKVDEIMEECTKPVYKKGRLIDERLDKQRLIARLGVESTVYPNFKDPELLKSYDKVDPVELVKEILCVPGEYAEWVMATQRINGFEEDFSDLVEEAKN